MDYGASPRYQYVYGLLFGAPTLWRESYGIGAFPLFFLGMLSFLGSFVLPTPISASFFYVRLSIRDWVGYT